MLSFMEHIRNGICIAVSSFTLFTVLYNTPEIVKCNLYLIAGHCITDLFFCTKDLTIHHISCIALSGINLYYLLPNPNSEIINNTIVLASCELSTFFLVFNSYLSKKSIFYNANQICFIGSFFYTRIYLFSKYLIYNQSLFNILALYLDNPIKSGIYYSALYTLYGLNIYWFSIMIKKIVKQCPNISIINCEYMLQYTYFMPVAYALYVYTNHSYNLIKPVFYYDIGGIIYLSYTSHVYHKNLKQRLIKNNSNISFNTIETPKDVWLYLHDIIGVNLRSALCVVTNTLALSKNNDISNVLCIAAVSIHTVSTFQYIKYILNTKSFAYITDDNDKEKNKEFGQSDIINYLIGIPIFVDSAIIFYNESNFYNKINCLVITFIIYLVMTIKPFYYMNHLALHLALFFQTMMLCHANINNSL